MSSGSDEESSFEYEPAVVMDNGTGNMKIGISGEDAPRSVFPVVMGRSEEEIDGQDTFIGEAAEKLREQLSLSMPIEHGVVTNWDDMEKVWEYCFFEVLEVDPMDQPVLLTEAPLNPLANREKMAEIMFETFDVPALYIALQAVLALYSTGRTTGLVCDSGDGVTHVVPVCDGFCLPHAVLRLNLAGRDLTTHMATMLGEKGVDFDFSTTAHKEIARDIKEKCCRVALDYTAELAAFEEGGETQSYELPDGTTIEIGAEAIRVPEALFQPKLVGMEAATAHGIANLAFDCVERCDIDLRRDLYGNTILSGGNTLFPGIVERMEKDLQELVATNMNVKIVAPPERAYSVWLGGAISSSLPGQEWISRPDYDEEGMSIVHRMTIDGRTEG